MGDYATIGPVRMYYETVGERGQPVVLLHGAYGGAFSWQGQIEALSARYRLFIPEQRGRAHTADVPGPMSFQAMTNDTLGFIESVVGEPVYLVGASDGGIIGLLAALKRPDVVHKLVAIGANYHYDGVVPNSGFGVSADDKAWARPRERYGQLSPDGPDHWPVLFEKLSRMWREEPTLTVGDLAMIEIPVLVIVGDDDVVAMDHTVTLYQALQQGQLAVIPGASHVVFMEQPDLINSLIERFLDAKGPPETLMPIRRA
ncbi:MAG TPA: alpha/beta hydrolase [Acidimicrobiia bacterium]|nr:alpha/beta hydrolase [Acidimicrobiia bacterium]